MVLDTPAVRVPVAPCSLGCSFQPLNHNALLPPRHITTAVEVHALSPSCWCLGHISFPSWRRTRGVNSWEWGGGGHPALVEGCLETTLGCKAENAASDFFHPPQMSARESIYYSLSNVLVADLKQLWLKGTCSTPIATPVNTMSRNWGQQPNYQLTVREAAANTSCPPPRMPQSPHWLLLLPSA